MDAPKKSRPININLKQIKTVDLSKQTSKAKAETSKSANNKASTDLNKSTDHSKSTQSTQGNQNKAKASSSFSSPNQKKPAATDQAAKQKSGGGSGNDLKQPPARSASSSSSDKTTSKKSADDQSNPATKKLKVPFAVQPANQTKSELKYLNENKNLRLLNKADETRKELYNIKIKKISERSNDRPTDRSNLKSIDTSNKIPPTLASNSNQSNQTNIVTLKTTNGLPSKPLIGTGVTANKPTTNPIIPDKSKPLLATPKGTNRLANFYLKSVPDQFNYLDDDSDDIIDINSFRNLNKARSQRKAAASESLNGSTSTSQSANQFTDQSQPPKDGGQFSSNNFSSQFLKSQKESLEIGELINYRIVSEDEKFRTRSVVNHLMKVLIEYKQSTYQPKLVEELNESLQKFSSDS